jgi:hypothetical protein
MSDETSTLYNWLLFGQVLAAMVWVGSLLTLIAPAVGALRGKKPQAVPGFFRNVRMVAPDARPRRAWTVGPPTTRGRTDATPARRASWRMHELWIHPSKRWICPSARIYLSVNGERSHPWQPPLQASRSW